MNAHQRRVQRRAARRELVALRASGDEDTERFYKLVNVFRSPIERRIERGWALFHAASTAEQPAIMSNIRKWQAIEADAIEARFVAACEMKPGDGYRALEIGRALIEKYSAEPYESVPRVRTEDMVRWAR